MSQVPITMLSRHCWARNLTQISLVYIQYYLWVQFIRPTLKFLYKASTHCMYIHYIRWYIGRQHINSFSSVLWIIIAKVNMQFRVRIVWKVKQASISSLNKAILPWQCLIMLKIYNSCKYWNTFKSLITKMPEVILLHVY